MTQRSPVTVALLTLITFGIYGIYWEVTTKGEMVAQGADIPTAWLIIVPFANIYWLWKWSAGVEKVTNTQLSGVLAFVLMYLAGPIGAAIIQDSFNKSAGGAPAQPNVGQMPMPPMGPASNPTPPTTPQPPIPPTQ